MKMRRMLFLLLTALLLVSVLPTGAFATDALSWKEIYTLGDAALENTRIDPTEIDGVQYLFLPANVSPKAVPLYFTVSDANAVVTVTGRNSAAALRSGETVDLTALCGAGETWTVTLRARSGAGRAEQALTFVQYDTVSTMYLVSEDPAEPGPGVGGVQPG